MKQPVHTVAAPRDIAGSWATGLDLLDHHDAAPTSRPVEFQPQADYRWTIVRTPGSFEVKRTNWTYFRSKSIEAAKIKAARAAADFLEAHGQVPDFGYAEALDFLNYRDARPVVGDCASRRGRITGWSFKSRVNLFRVLHAHDFGSDVWAMTTLTLPAEWWRYAPTPDHFKALHRSYWKRWERAFSDDRFAWKFETQRRSAPHSHLCHPLPADITRADLDLWIRRTWHDLVVHDGAICPDRLDGSGDRCAEPHHASFGARLDTRYSNLDAKQSIAAYFAKHGVWGSKRYQNEAVSNHLRRAAAAVSFMSGVPLPQAYLLGDLVGNRSAAEGGRATEGRQSVESPRLLPSNWRDTLAAGKPCQTSLDTYGDELAADNSWPEWYRWGDTLDLVDAWTYTGRWWGIRGIDRPDPEYLTLPPAQAEALRLICRKLFVRRSTRFERRHHDDGREILRRDGTVVNVVFRRQLRSLRSVAGWFMHSSDPQRLVDGILAASEVLAEVRPGIPRARWLAEHVDRLDALQT